MRAPRLCAVFAILAFAPAAGADEYVVLESEAAAYMAGQVLDAAAPIMLAEDEFVVLASETGRLLRVEGPHDGPAAGDPPADESGARRGLARLIGASPPDVGLGGVRAGPDDEAVTDTRPDPWLVHAGLGGEQCVIRDRRPELWREDAARSEVFAVVDVVTDESAEIRWPETRHEAAWPLGDPPSDNRVYLVRPVDAIHSVAIRLHTLAPDSVSHPLAAVAWLAAKGCTEQARMLLAAAG